MSEPSRDVRAIVRNVYVCFFLSGALGLAYQVLWLRKLLLVFGSTVHAVSTVLTVFFGGLALGSWWFGKQIDRHEADGLRWYAGLEAAVGVYAFLTPALFAGIQHLYIPLYRASHFSPVVLVSASFVCAAMVLLPPTFLMGGTFPVLSRFFIRTSEGRGITIAGLYSINTAGAMVGTLLVYYVGLPVLGFWRTLVCAGVLNLGIGMLCLTFDRHLESVGFRASPAAIPSAPPLPQDDTPGAGRWIMAAFGLSGFSAMVYEVTWTRALSLVLGSSIYAFCLMLATFLGGMAIGSAWAHKDLRQRPATIHRFMLNELILALYGFCSVPLLSQMPDWFVALWPMTGGSFVGVSMLQVVLSVFVMLLPAVVMGLLFPIVTDLVTQRFAHLGRRVGNVYAVNTVGGIVGSFLSGFVLIPIFGLPWAIACAALVNLIAGLGLYLRFGKSASVVRLAVASASVLVAVVASHTVILPSWQRQGFAAGVYMNAGDYRNMTVTQGNAGVKTLFYRDSLNATVSVHQLEDTLFLKVGGKTDASNGLDMGTQVLSAHIPLLLHPDAKRVFVIGLGSGVTLGSAGRHPVQTLDCAEIDPAVIDGARFFQRYNHDIHEDPRTRIYAVDGRNFLLATNRTYDVIISEPSNPWMAGIAYLFTKEFYQLAKRRLAPGGVMCQWVQLYNIFPRDVKLLLKTFHSEFPHVTVWSSIPGDLLLVGSMKPQQLEYQRLSELMAQPKIHESLQAVQVERPDVLLQLYWMGNKEVEELTADVSWIHEDDQPSLEFSAPKAIYARPEERTDNFAGLQAFKSAPQAIAPAYDSTAEDARHFLAVGIMWAARFRDEKAIEALERATTLEPSLREAWARLGDLYARKTAWLKAEYAFSQAIRAAGERGDADAYVKMARIQRQQGRLREASAFYEQAARVSVPDGPTASEIGRCLWELHEWLLAAEYFRSALSQLAEPPHALLAAYAESLRETRAAPAAEQVFRFGARQFPQMGSFLFSLGDLLLSERRPAEAEPVFRAAVAVAPGNIEGYYGLGRIAAQQGLPQQAVRLLKDGLARNPYHREALKLLAQLQHNRT